MVPVAIVLLVLLDQLVKWYVVKNIHLFPYGQRLIFFKTRSAFLLLKISNGSLPSPLSRCSFTISISTQGVV